MRNQKDSGNPCLPTSLGEHSRYHLKEILIALGTDKFHLVNSGLFLQMWALQGTPLWGNPGRALGPRLFRNSLLSHPLCMFPFPFSISPEIGRRQLQPVLKAEQIKLFCNWFHCRESIRLIYSNQFWVKAIKESLSMSSVSPGNPADGLTLEVGA